MKVWVVGPIAWDSVLYVGSIPSTGSFTHAKSHLERPGGQALNVAVALERSGIESGLIGYVGNDSYGEDLKTFAAKELKNIQIKTILEPTPHVVILVTDDGERTIVGMEKSHFGTISINHTQIESEDTVVWPIWRESFKKDFDLVKAKGCRTIVGLGALKDEISADIAIGSAWELPTDFKKAAYLARFPRIIVTDNKYGSQEYNSQNDIKQEALLSEAVDTTGAGDAFLCGIVKAALNNLDGIDSLKLAATWSAQAIKTKESIPPTLN